MWYVYAEKGNVTVSVAKMLPNCLEMLAHWMVDSLNSTPYMWIGEWMNRGGGGGMVPGAT